MKTKIYCYRGMLAIHSSVDAEGVISSPATPGCVGFVVRADSLLISPEALAFIQKVENGANDIGGLDCFRDSDGTVLFGWLGSSKRVVDLRDGVFGANDSDFSLLKATGEVEPDLDFMQLVDRLLDRKWR